VKAVASSRTPHTLNLYGVRRLAAALIAGACYRASQPGTLNVTSAGSMYSDAITVVLLNAAASHRCESGSKLPHSMKTFEVLQLPLM